ncbi:MAG: DUF1698 domain-containing protein [Candidatus Eisenbacteria bacterium]|jgi:tRNA (mo5U34)-methyltransferase|nr:DUF1698 domain-containing protein [Candidatus Eisenbacteria bacterium]
MKGTLKGIDEIQWWHIVPLGDGRVTPGRSDVSRLEDVFLYPALELEGKSVLDIGCWDGYFSFRSEQRGASRVVAMDDPDLRWGGMDGFEFLHDHFQSKVEFVKRSIYQPLQEQFDVVLCYGVLYHVNDPLTAATNAFQMSKDIAAFESLILDVPDPILLLLEPGSVNNDPTNLYMISTAWLDTVAKLNGFERVQHFQQTPQRGATIYRRVKPAVPAYPAFCYSLPPINAPKS